MKLKQAVEGFKVHRLSDGFSPETIENYEYGLGKLIAFLDNPEVSEIKTEHVRNFFFHLRTNTKLSSTSVHTIWCAVRSFFGWAAEELGLPRPDDTPAPVRTDQEIVPFTEDEIKALLKACDTSRLAKPANRGSFTMRQPTANRNKALILLLLDTGLRASEVARLQLRDVNLETGDVRVVPHLSGKKSRGRTTHLGKAARRALWRYLAERETAKPEDPLFMSTKTGTFMDRNSLRLIIDHISERAGVQNAHLHKFRHTFAIQFLRNGGDIFTLQRMLGHARLEMVRHYLALADADDANAHRRASPADNWHL